MVTQTGTRSRTDHRSKRNFNEQVNFPGYPNPVGTDNDEHWVDTESRVSPNSVADMDKAIRAEAVKG